MSTVKQQDTADPAEPDTAEPSLSASCRHCGRPRGEHLYPATGAYCRVRNLPLFTFAPDADDPHDPAQPVLSAKEHRWVAVGAQALCLDCGEHRLIYGDLALHNEASRPRAAHRCTAGPDWSTTHGPYCPTAAYECVCCLFERQYALAVMVEFLRKISVASLER